MAAPVHSPVLKGTLMAPKTSGKSRSKGSRGAAATAEDILADDAASKRIAELGAQLLDTRATTATHAARVLGEIVARKPTMTAPLVDKFVAGLTSPHKRVAQTAAEGLATLSRSAPAKVARHLDKLKAAFDEAAYAGRDGVVRTFSGLCTASVSYQERVEPTLTRALQQADGKTLRRWSEIVLPALKGEPHARARAVVEQRLVDLSRAEAQPIAELLGIKLRANTR